MESYDVTSKKPRKPRSDSGPRLTERDRKALSWIGQQYAVRPDHLQILLARLAEPDKSYKSLLVVVNGRSDPFTYNGQKYIQPYRG